MINFGTALSVGGTVTGVIIGLVGTNAVRVGTVEMLTYTTGAIVGWSLVITFGLLGILIIPVYGHMKYDDGAK